MFLVNIDSVSSLNSRNISKIIKILGLFFILILIACTSETGKSWSDNPNGFLNDEEKILDTTGLKEKATLTLSGIPDGFKYVLYRSGGSDKVVNLNKEIVIEDKCGGEDSIKVSEGIILGKTDMGEVVFSDGINDFYAKVDGDNVDLCLFVGSYYKVVTEIELTPVEGGIEVNWNFDREIELTSAYISINQGEYRLVERGEVLSDLPSVLTDIDIKLVNNDNDSLERSSNVRPLEIADAIGSLRKEGDSELSVSGLANNGKLKLENANIDDKIEIYTQEGCLGELVATTFLDSAKELNLDFDIGINSFYIKRYPKGGNVLSSCSDVINYERKEIIPELIARDANIIEFISDDDFTYEASINDGEFSEVSPSSNLNLSEGEQKITIKITDSDGNEVLQDYYPVSYEVAPVLVTLEKEDGSKTLDSSGVASGGKIKITENVTIGDKLSVYGDSYCETDLIESEVVVIDNEVAIDVDFNYGLNNFFIKRVSENGTFSCSKLISYHRKEVAIDLIPADNHEIVSDVILVSDSFVETENDDLTIAVSIDDASDIIIDENNTLEDVLRGLTGDHVVTVTITDQDGNI